MTSLRNLIATTLLVVSGALVAQSTSGELQSDWLEFVKGYRDNTLGVELMSIEPGEVEGMQKITLSIPKASMTHPDTIEEVLVVGRMPEKREPLDIQYEWLRDYDDEHYGLVIYLGKNSTWPIRLFMNSNAGYIR